MRVGVLALQGAFAAHARMLSSLGVSATEVRLPSDLIGVDGLVMPGGESTTMSMLLESSGLFDAIEKRLVEDMPVLGTCAGLILLATDIADGRSDQRSFGRIDVEVKRNGYGRQVESFETAVRVDELGRDIPAVFIRAPLVTRVGSSVDVLALDDHGNPALVRSGRALASAFHPELADDTGIHELFVDSIPY